MDTDFSGSVDERRIMIYDSAWRLVEEEIDTDLDDDADEARAHVWGLRYIDDAIAMFRDTDADGDYEDGGGSERYFFITDAQFSVMAVLDDAANLKERIRYDAYGRARHHDWRDVDGDGDYDTDDLTIIETIVMQAFTALGMPISNATWYDPDADLNRDGWVSMADAGLAGVTWSAALARGVLSSDAVGNTTGYNGYRYIAEMMQYVVRNRWYDPVLGRWLQRDPAGYVDGENLFQMVRSSPTSRVDTHGERTVSIDLHTYFPWSQVGIGPINGWLTVADGIFQACFATCIPVKGGKPCHKVIINEVTHISQASIDSVSTGYDKRRNPTRFKITIELGLRMKNPVSGRSVFGNTTGHEVFFDETLIREEARIAKVTRVQLFGVAVAHEVGHHAIGGTWGHPYGAGFVDSTPPKYTAPTAFSPQACSELCDEMDIDR